VTGVTQLRVHNLLRSWRARVAVRGHSMAPTLLDGDWLLVDPDAYGNAEPRLGDLVLAASDHGLVVKRFAGSSPSGELRLRGDAPSEDGHGHDLDVRPNAVEGRAWFRYWPLRRAGRVG
jgi:signal peptidase I